MMPASSGCHRVRALVGSEFCSLSAAAGQYDPQIVVKILVPAIETRGFTVKFERSCQPKL